MGEPNDGPVCVTGASGFIATHLVEQLLAKGYTVRGTVRSTKDLNKYKYLTDLPGASERLQLFAANLSEEGSFDEAVLGCQCVMHTASPYVMDVKNPKRDLIVCPLNPSNTGVISNPTSRILLFVAPSPFSNRPSEPMSQRSC